MIEKDQVWRDKKTGIYVLVLRVGYCYVNYQQDGFIKQLTPDEFLEQFERGEGDE